MRKQKSPSSGLRTTLSLMAEGLEIRSSFQTDLPIQWITLEDTCFEGRARCESRFHPPTAPGKENAMLVLSRQRDETIMIGDDVQVTVVDIRGEKVRLGITAPPHIPVHRKEVYEAIQREQAEGKKVESLAIRKKAEEKPPDEKDEKKEE